MISLYPINPDYRLSSLISKSTYYISLYGNIIIVLAINELRNEAPAFYDKFSELLNKTIDEYRKKRLSEKDHFKQLLLDKDHLRTTIRIATECANGPSADSLLSIIHDDPDAQAFYDALLPRMKELGQNKHEVIATIALDTLNIIKPHLIVRWETNEEKSNKISKELYNYFLEAVDKKMLTSITTPEIEKISEALMNICKKRFPGK